MGGRKSSYRNIALSPRRKKESIAYMALPGLKSTYKFPACLGVTVNKIEDMVTEAYGLDIDDLKRKSRRANLVMARHVCMWLIRKYTNHSLKSIAGRYCRDHTTAINSIKVINDLMFADHIVRKNVNDFEFRLQ